MPIVTVIAAGRLDDSLIARAIDLSGGALRWRDGVDAAAFIVDGDVFDAKAALASLEGEADVVVVGDDVSGPPRLFVADMDSTMIGQECIDELADYAGFKPEVAEITERAMRGELDFAHALAERVALLSGLEKSVIARCLKERIRPNAGAKTLVATLKARGARTLLVSGGFTDFVAPIARELCFDDFRANVLAAEGARLIGETEGPIVDAAAKRRAAEVALAEIGVGPETLMAVGDGANDAAMVELAGAGIGYHPKPALAAIANGSIRHHDLTALLWVAGIPKAKWIA